MGELERSGQVTRMLLDWSRGDLSAAEKLTPLVYEELRRLASSYMQSERQGHLLQPTALIHEVFLRLVNQGQPEWQSRSHFFRFSAHLMRQILVDHARSRQTAKRGGGFVRLTLESSAIAAPERGIDLLALDHALERLSAFDTRRARVLEMRYFGGMTEEEVSESLQISVATVRRDLRLAEAWLAKELAGK